MAASSPKRKSGRRDGGTTWREERGANEGMVGSGRIQRSRVAHRTAAQTAGGREKNAAAAACQAPVKTEVEDELEGSGCKLGKVQGPRSKVKFSTELGLK